MKKINGRTFDEERALYGREDIYVTDCRFDGPADGESAFKECRNARVEHSFFNLRYPFWHVRGLAINDCEMTPACRAALWYSERVEVADTALHGIKALRECADVRVKNCDIRSTEFGWSVRGIRMEDSDARGEYFMMRSEGLRLDHVNLTGKYSFQYIRDAVLENCVLDTKDAFWHAKNVTVRNSVIQGAYLAWYSEDVTFENCRITGTQPLCYCKGLKLIDCEMTGCDLAFERSEVEADILTSVISVKNPLSGHIRLPEVGEVIRDIDGVDGRVKIRKNPTRQICA